ncbi:hypothetical protein T484DRAFT_1862966 [Baffinella frigidus]|nr:hypothetical protein T484DRAFT_1862966 [Cryptophyta sp. CCMP2293]
MLRAVLLLAAVSAAAAFSPASFLAPTSRGATQFGGRAAFTSAPPARVALATGHAQRSLRPVGAAAGGLTMEQAFGIVITGAAAGVGFAYADEFLSRGHKAEGS